MGGWGWWGGSLDGEGNDLRDHDPILDAIRTQIYSLDPRLKARYERLLPRFQALWTRQRRGLSARLDGEDMTLRKGCHVEERISSMLLRFGMTLSQLVEPLRFHISAELVEKM